MTPLEILLAKSQLSHYNYNCNNNNNNYYLYYYQHCYY